MKKIILVALSALLVLVACGAKEKNAIDIAKALDTNENKEIMITDGAEITKGRIPIESMSKFYTDQKSVLEVLDETTLTDDEKAFHKNYLEFSSLLLEGLSNEEDIDIAYLGIIEEDVVSGIMIYTFPKDFKIEQTVVEGINTSKINDFEYVYVNKNIVITVDHGFISDINLFWSNVDEVILDLFGE